LAPLAGKDRLSLQFSGMQQYPYHARANRGSNTGPETLTP
jgi:hypothetical protein